MLNKLRVAVYGAAEEGVPRAPPPADPRPPKFVYSRPAFLRLASEDEVQAAADRSIRPIMVPRDITCMPWMAGYAEAVNAGKSKRNEDTAHIHVGTLQRPDGAGQSVPYYYFGLFDGHAGYGASTAAANQLHHIIHERLVDVVEHLLPAAADGAPEPAARAPADFLWVSPGELSVDKLVTGALEAAFHQMDEQIACDRRQYEMRGGCTALVALFLLGRLYVANAGDSRALLCRRGRAMVASHDFTPETERQRVRQLASRQPSLCGGEFTHLEFCRRLTRRDLGQRVLYRDAHMTGWAYKTVTESDVKFPVVCGEGKRSRVCATIGVTRGFGDHGLRAQNTSVYVKPFLLSQPEVLVIDLEGDAVTECDVLVLGTDGLWDVVSNQRVAELVQRALDHFPAHDQTVRRYRCISAAQELVMAARGKLLRESRGQWRRSDGTPGTVDDISVFVVPLLDYREEHLAWKAQTAAAPPTPCVLLTNGVTELPACVDTAFDGVPPDADPPAALDAGDGGPPELTHPDGRTPDDGPERAGGDGQTSACHPADSEAPDVSRVPLAGVGVVDLSSGGSATGLVSSATDAPACIPVVPAVSDTVTGSALSRLVPPSSQNALVGAAVPSLVSPVVLSGPSPIVALAPSSNPTVPAATSIAAVTAVPSSAMVPAIPSNPAVRAAPSSPAVPAVPSRPTVPPALSSPTMSPAPSRPAVPAAPSNPVVTVVPYSPAVPPSIPAVPVTDSSRTVPPTPSSPAVPTTPCSVAASDLSAPALPVPSGTVSSALCPSGAPVASSVSASPGSAAEEPVAVPLIVGQMVPPALDVQTLPRSRVQLLPPAPVPGECGHPGTDESPR